MTYRDSTPKHDVYQRVTDTIVAAIENGAGDWSFPWRRNTAANDVPVSRPVAVLHQ